MSSDLHGEIKIVGSDENTSVMSKTKQDFSIEEMSETSHQSKSSLTQRDKNNNPNKRKKSNPYQDVISSIL